MSFKRRLPKRRDWTFILAGLVVGFAIVGVVTWHNNQKVPLKLVADSITIPWVPSTVKRWEAPIVEMSAKYNIDPDLLAIIMTLESGGYSKASSEAGAEGLMQVTPLTGKDIATKYVKEPATKYDLGNPRTSIEFGAAYLAVLRDNFGTAKQGPAWDSTVELIAAGYNGGPGASNALEQGKGLKDPQTVIYSRDAFNMWRERHASSSPTFDRWKERGGYILLNKAVDE